MRVLVTGASGLCGSKIAQLSTQGNSVYSGYNRDKPIYGIPIQFDISNLNQVTRAFKKLNPDVVVHAAALTNVDDCETNKQLAWKINVEGTRNIVEAAIHRLRFQRQKRKLY